MRIAYVTHARLPSSAANAVQTLKMAHALAEAGHDVVLFSRPGEAVDVQAAFAVGPNFVHEAIAASGPRGARTGRWLAVLRRRIASFAPDVVYSRDILALCAVGGDAKLCFEAHWSPRHSPVLRAALVALSVRRSFVRIVAISAALRREMIDLLPSFPAENIVVVPSAADDPHEGQGPERPNSQHRLQVGYAGQLYSGKGAELFAPIARAMPDVDFRVVGGEQKDVERWAKGAPKNLQFHGYRPHSQVANFLGELDVVLAPYQAAVSVSGGAEVSQWMSPLKIYEYMAMGKAIVVSDLPVLRECLTNNKDALLVDASDVGAWCRAIDRLRSPILRADLGAAARAAFLRAHTWPQRAQAVVQDLPARRGMRSVVAGMLRGRP
jgi:glycosyltransferase involved in cell wall biosynthesis